MISGFSIVRNAVKLNYPFREAVESILPLCGELVLNVGKSSDGTLELCQEIQRKANIPIRLVETDWNTTHEKGGNQLSIQTNIALNHCKGEWCFYIQADEAIHEEDLSKIQRKIEVADQNPYIDGLVFDYLHFYGDYAHHIIGRNWYRREVRVFKNYRGVQSFRDAQGFRKNGSLLKVIASDSRVFHYGHVRTPMSRATKETEMNIWWGKSEESVPKELPFIKHVGIRKYWGTHPQVMQERIQKTEPLNFTRLKREWNFRELKNLITIGWERIFKKRLWEFRNYEFI